MAVGSDLTTPNEFIIMLAKSTLKVVDSIPLHDAWCAACFVHPGLSTFSFLSNSQAKLALSYGEAVLAAMISGNSHKNNNTPEKPSTTTETEICVVGGNLGSSSWSLSNQMSFQYKTTRDD